MRRRRASTRASRKRRHRRLLLEPLEDRWLLATFTVNSTAYSRDGDINDNVCDTGSVQNGHTGNCTLLAAVMQSNATPGSDTIQFALGPGTPVISMGGLPEIREPVQLRGDTGGATRIEIRPINTFGTTGLQLRASDSLIRSFVIHGFSTGISAWGDRNRIEDCYIGTDATGESVGGFQYDHPTHGLVQLGNRTGIGLGGSDNVIGGANEEARNVISGNLRAIGVQGDNNTVQGNLIGTNVTGRLPIPNYTMPHANSGVVLSGTNNKLLSNVISGNGLAGNADAVAVDVSGAGTVVQGNMIGVDIDGLQSMPNSGTGVMAEDGVQVGGVVPGQGNIISGNGDDGVFAKGGVRVQGNFIGVDETGKVAIPNGDDGVYVEGSNNTIGGVGFGVPNIISGNGGDGVHIGWGVARGRDNQVQGNLIGKAIDGTPLGNTGHGVLVDANYNTIGGNVAGAGNVIAHNGGIGVLVKGLRVGTRIQRNSIHDNDSFGISIVHKGGGAIGLHANDPDDADNAWSQADYGLQNWPEIYPIAIQGNELRTRVRVDTAVQHAAFPLEIDFYVADSNVVGAEGKHYLGTIEYAQADAQLAVIRTFQPTTMPTAGDPIVATATDADGNTSEFSFPPVPVDAVWPIIVNSTGDQPDPDTQDGVCDAEPGTTGLQCTFRAAIQEANARTGKNEINFEIPVHPRINVGSALPPITDRVIIDGTTQPGYSRVILNGGVAGGGTANGLRIEAGHSVVNGLAINGFQGYGMVLANAGHNTIVNNNIGTDIYGSEPWGNKLGGILIDNTPDNTIGGTTAGNRNVISSNQGEGIEIRGQSATGNRVQGNYIGTNRGGQEASMGNGGNGVSIHDASGNSIGGTWWGAGNVIASNGSNGVVVTGANAINNPILANSIFSNENLGIDLGNDLVTGNDLGDGDAGANHLQNFPLLVEVTSGSTIVKGKLNSRANTTYRVEFFANDECGSWSHGQGEQYLSAQDVTTDAQGNAAFTFTYPDAAENITMTATDPKGNTSEFSRCMLPIIVNSTGDGDDLDKGDGVCSTGGIILRDGTPEFECTLRAAISEANALTGSDEIRFDIPGEGIPWIRPRSPLPSVEEPVTVDASTQPDGNRVGLLGSDAGVGTNGLTISAGNTTVKSFVIQSFHNAIVLKDQGGNLIQSNYIGVSSDGNTDRVGPFLFGNHNDGILIDYTADNTIRNNVISGNMKHGVEIRGEQARYNKLQGNYIGTNANGTVDLGNWQNGVYINNAPLNTIGGTSQQERNVISGNDGRGIHILSDPLQNNASYNKVLGNYIGTESNGSTALGNRQEGIRIEHASNNSIGGPTNTTAGGPCTGGCNVISGNSPRPKYDVSDEIAHQGIVIHGSTAQSNHVQSNHIGMDASGDFPVRGGGVGVLIELAPNNTIGGSGGAIGEPCKNQCNLISGSKEYNVYIVGDTARLNQVSGNFIGTDIEGLRPGYLKDPVTERVIMATGVRISDAPQNRIGGLLPDQRNLISGNYEGVQIQNHNARFNEVMGNLIGTNLHGAKLNRVFGNQKTGVEVLASHNTIGGTTNGARNVISGYDTGVWVREVEDIVVQGNYIGLGADGKTDIGNGTGIDVYAAVGAVIGGASTVPGQPPGNVISGNNSDGISLHMTDLSRIQGNLIGTKADGVSELKNIHDGIRLGTDGIFGNTIGGTEVGEGNVIAFNAGHGISLGGSVASTVLRNLIFANDGPEYRLNGWEQIEGAEEQSPALTSASASTRGIVARGTLEKAAGTYRVEFFLNSRGEKEARDFLGWKDVTTDGGEHAFAVRFPKIGQSHPYLTATVTEVKADGSFGATSNFSDTIKVLPDSDGDGGSDVEEGYGPGDGDANGDNIPDNHQSNVATLTNAKSGDYVTLSSPIGTDIIAIPQGSPSPKNQPGGFGGDPLGFFEIIVENITPGGAADVTMQLPPGTDVNTYYQYGSTPDDPTPHWYEWLYDGTTGAELILDQELIVLHFVDGQRGDHDLTANGTIVDPGAPMFITTGSLSGYVYADVNNNGIKEPHELGLPNVPITVDGPVRWTVVTDADGRYEFVDLPVGQYTVTQLQPSAFNDGIDTPNPAFQGEAEDDGFVDVGIEQAKESASYNFGERGLRGEFVSRWYLMNSTPPADQYVLQLTGGIGATSFKSTSNGTFTANAEGEGLASIELYTADMMPVAIGAAGEPLSAAVAEGESYVLLVTGSDGPVDLQTAIQPLAPVYLTNASNPLDVDANGMTTPLDVLVLINALNAGSIVDGSQVYYVDVNSDKQLTPLDVLTVINHLNTNARQSSATGGEGEPSSQFELPFEPDVLLGTVSDSRLGAAHMFCVSHALCAGLPTPHTAPTEGLQDAQAEGDLVVARVGLDPRNTTPTPEPSSLAADPSDDESLPESLELEPILSDFAADVDDVWRASV